MDSNESLCFFCASSSLIDNYEQQRSHICNVVRRFLLSFELFVSAFCPQVLLSSWSTFPFLFTLIFFLGLNSVVGLIFGIQSLEGRLWNWKWQIEIHQKRILFVLCCFFITTISLHEFANESHMFTSQFWKCFLFNSSKFDFAIIHDTDTSSIPRKASLEKLKRLIINSKIIVSKKIKTTNNLERKESTSPPTHYVNGSLVLFGYIILEMKMTQSTEICRAEKRLVLQL